LNSPTQSLEVVQMNRGLIETHKKFKEKNLQTIFFDYVHDAVELQSLRHEVPEVCRTIKAEFEKDYPEYEGIPFEMEGNVADYFQTENTFKKDSNGDLILDKEGNKISAHELWDDGHDWEKDLKC